MNHELKRTWVEGRGFMLHCVDCDCVYSYAWVNDPSVPTCPAVDGVCCNQCGEDMNQGHCSTDTGLRTIVAGGYDGPRLYDMTLYRFRICEHCLVKLFAGFELPVFVKDSPQDDGWRPMEPKRDLKDE